MSINNLALLYQHQGRYGEAEPLFKRALEAQERLLGREHPNTLLSVNNLAVLYEVQGRHGEAAPLMLRVGVLPVVLKRRPLELRPGSPRMIATAPAESGTK